MQGGCSGQAGEFRRVVGLEQWQTAGLPNDSGELAISVARGGGCRPGAVCSGAAVSCRDDHVTLRVMLGVIEVEQVSIVHRSTLEPNGTTLNSIIGSRIHCLPAVTTVVGMGHVHVPYAAVARVVALADRR